jgi:hypothetical protein
MLQQVLPMRSWKLKILTVACNGKSAEKTMSAKYAIKDFTGIGNWKDIIELIQEKNHLYVMCVRRDFLDQTI